MGDDEGVNRSFSALDHAETEDTSPRRRPQVRPVLDASPPKMERARAALAQHSAEDVAFAAAGPKFLRQHSADSVGSTGANASKLFRPEQGRPAGQHKRPGSVERPPLPRSLSAASPSRRKPAGDSAMPASAARPAAAMTPATGALGAPASEVRPHTSACSHVCAHV